MSLSGREIDELLAEFTGEKKAKSMSNTTEIDNILLSIGKQPNKATAKPVSVLQPTYQEDEPAEVPAKKGSLFSRFFEEDDDDEYEAKRKPVQPPKKSKPAQAAPLQAAAQQKPAPIKQAEVTQDTEKQPPVQAAEKAPAHKFNDEMFAATFAPVQDSSNTRSAAKKTAVAERKATPATLPAAAPQEPAHIKQAEVTQGAEKQPPVQATEKQPPVQATEKQPPVQAAEKAPVHKFNDEMFAATFATQQEPVIKAQAKQKDRQQKEFDQLLPIVEKATNAVAEENALIHEPSVRRAGSPDLGTLRDKLLSSVKEKAFTTEEDEEYAEAEKVKKVVEQAPIMPAAPMAAPSISQLSVKDDEVPTVEFALHNKAGLKPSAPKAVVIGPDGENEIPLIRRPVPTVASEVDDTFRDFFGETVAVSREEIEDGLKAKKAGALLRTIFGKRNEETGEIENVEINDNDEIEDEASDYNSPADAPEVEESLTALRFNATLRAVAVCLTTALLVYLGLSARTGLLPPIPFLDPVAKPLFYLIANFALLIITGLVCISSLINGFKSLFKAPSADSLTAIAFLGAFVQGAAFILAPKQFDPAALTLFAPVAAVSLLFNTVGKRMQCTTVTRNFETVSAGYDHSAAYLLKSRELSMTVASGLAQDEPVLLVSRPTALVKGFLSQSFSESSRAYTARILSFVVLGASLIILIISLAQGGSLATALTAFAAVCSLCAPFSATLLQAVPASLLQKNASRVGAVVPGWSAIESLGTVNTVLINAKDLFLPSSVRLHGIKTFEKERIDLAILYAASVLIDGCDTLRDIFLGVIENKTEMLYKVESLTVEPNYGFSAWIEHTRVIIGNRAMMQQHDINTPSLDYEMKYTKGEKCPIYLAVSGKLFGMFLVSYAPCEEVDEVLYSLSSAGISIAVKSDDFNITSELIADLYGLKRNAVKVLNGSERDVLAPKTAYLPESEGILTHLGSLGSFAGGLRAAAAAAGGVKMAAFVQIAAVILGLVLCLVLVISQSLVSISLTAVLLFQLAWTILTIALPFTKKY